LTLLVPQSVVQAGTTPNPITPTASDTIPASAFGPNGCFLRVITTSTASNVSVLDPTTTALNNPGTVTALAVPAGVARMVLVPKAAINSSGFATVTSSSQAGMTYELYTA
jgi:hypothetical protein